MYRYYRVFVVVLILSCTTLSYAAQHDEQAVRDALEVIYKYAPDMMPQGVDAVVAQWSAQSVPNKKELLRVANELNAVPVEQLFEIQVSVPPMLINRMSGFIITEDTIKQYNRSRLQEEKTRLKAEQVRLEEENARLREKEAALLATGEEQRTKASEVKLGIQGQKGREAELIREALETIDAMIASTKIYNETQIPLFKAWREMIVTPSDGTRAAWTTAFQGMELGRTREERVTGRLRDQQAVYTNIEMALEKISQRQYDSAFRMLNAAKIKANSETLNPPDPLLTKLVNLYVDLVKLQLSRAGLLNKAPGS